MKEVEEYESDVEGRKLINLDDLNPDEIFDTSTVKKKKQKVQVQRIAQAPESHDDRGPAVVPFFPSHWQEGSNAIFN